MTTDQRIQALSTITAGLLASGNYHPLISTDCKVENAVADGHAILLEIENRIANDYDYVNGIGAVRKTT